MEKVPPARLLSLGARFFLTAALTAAEAPGGYAPFALGFVAAAGPGSGGGAALAGAAAGALLFLEFADALPFLATALLIVTASTAFQGISALEKPVCLPAAAAGLHLAVSGIYVAQSLSPADRLPPCIAASCLTGLAAWFLRPLLGKTEDLSPADGALFLAAALLLGVSGEWRQARRRGLAWD